MKNSGILLAAIIIVALNLTACGGSGGSGGASSGVTTTTTVTSTTTTTLLSSTIVSSVAPANYAGGTFKRAYYDYLNARRLGCGFGLLQQESHVDTAAQNHATWMFNNGQVVHIENQSSYPAGFTGATTDDRLAYAGYVFTGRQETLTTTVTAYGTTYGQAGVMNFFVAPYHGWVQLQGYRDIGIGDVDFPAQSGFPELEWHNTDFGVTAARPMQLLGSTDVATYPCNGVTGVLSKSYQNEIPAPIPGRSLSSNPIGHPIYIKVRDGQSLVLNTYDLKIVGTSTSLSMILLNQSTDTQSVITDSSSAILMPNLPLATNANYLFTATGTNNGQTINISFIFSTGAY